MSKKKDLQERLETIQQQLRSLGSQLDDLREIVQPGELERKVTKIVRESRIGLEDQLFFSLVFSLALLVITIPSLDIGTLFESFGVKLELPTQILSTQLLMIFLLLISSALRYSVCLLEESSKKGNRLRASSVGLLVFSFYLLLLDLLIRGLGTFLGEINSLLLLLPPALVMVASHFFGIAEKKWLSIYGYEGQGVSVPIFGLGVFVFTTYGLAYIWGILVPPSLLALVFLFVISFVVTIGIVKLYAKKL